MDLPTLDKLEMSEATVGRLNEAVKYLENMVMMPEVSVVLASKFGFPLHLRMMVFTQTATSRKWFEISS